MRETEISEEPKSKNLSHGAKFMQPLSPGFLNTFSIPESFLDRFKADGYEPEIMVLVVDDKRNWPVKLKGGRHFGDGWKEFAVHNDLGVGDFLVFTHVFNFIFNVTVYDPTTASARQYSPFSNDSSFEGTEKTDGLNFNDRFTHKRNPVEDDAATAQVPSVESQYPSCRVTLCPSGFKNSQANFPKEFIRSTGLFRRCCYMKLVDGEGNTWKVKLNSKKSSGQSYIGEGWKDFQVAKSLKPGDVIIFQMLKNGERPVLKCYRLCSRKRHRG